MTCSRYIDSLRACCREFADALEAAMKERDTARAQVETLAVALKWYADATAIDVYRPDDCTVEPDNGTRARAALKAAGLGET